MKVSGWGSHQLAQRSLTQVWPYHASAMGRLTKSGYNATRLDLGSRLGGNVNMACWVKLRYADGKPNVYAGSP